MFLIHPFLLEWQSLRARTDKAALVKKVDDHDNRMVIKQVLSFTLTEKVVLSLFINLLLLVMKKYSSSLLLVCDFINGQGTFVRDVILEEFAKVRFNRNLVMLLYRRLFLFSIY